MGFTENLTTNNNYIISNDSSNSLTSNTTIISTVNSLTASSPPPSQQSLAKKTKNRNQNAIVNRKAKSVSKKSNIISATISVSNNNSQLNFSSNLIKMPLAKCAGCEMPILDQYLYNVLDRPWHQTCIQCDDCKLSLNDKCFSREGKIFCKDDFIR